MDQAYEVLIVSSKKCYVYDAEKGSQLCEYNQGGHHGKDVKSLTPKTLALLNDHYMIGAVDKQIKVWNVNGHETKKQAISVVAGPVSVLTATSCGTYCIAGIQNYIYIWEVMSGKLVMKTSLHDHNVSCLKFSSDDSLLLSGCKSGRVRVCLLSELISVSADRKRIEVFHKWNHHAAEVTDIYTGCLGLSSRAATTSIDMTCKLYELDTGILLSTIVLDAPLFAVVMDPLEYYIFLGDDSGHIYKVDTYERLPRELHYNEKQVSKIEGHSSKIISMSFSLEGTKFMSASSEACKIWDVGTLSCLQEITFVADELTNAFLTMKPQGMSERNVAAPFPMPIFERNFDVDSTGENGEKKSLGLRPAKIVYQELSLKHQFRPEEFYNKCILNGHVKTADSLPSSIMENMFLEALHGEAMSELRVVNNQLYSYLVNHGLDNLPSSSHSSD